MSQWGRGVGGPLVGASPPAQAAGAQVASGYMPGDTLSTCSSSVSFSFYTFLRFAASWAGVDTNIRTNRHFLNVGSHVIDAT